MPLLDWREEPISRHHDRKRFDCGVAELNDYLDRYARQNHQIGGAKTFVAVRSAEPERALGFYSISPGAIEFSRIPSQLTKKLGRYEVPVFRLGRLATDRSITGKGSAVICCCQPVRAHWRSQPKWEGWRSQSMQKTRRQQAGISDLVPSRCLTIRSN